MFASAHVAIRRIDRQSARRLSCRLKPAARSYIAICAMATLSAAGAQDAAIAAFKTVDSMEARVQGCATCHGQRGQGTSDEYFPRLAGKPATYLYNQLLAFREGKRVYPPMNYLVAYLPDAYLKDIAEHFAKERPAFQAKQQNTAAAAVIARGATLAI